MEKLLNGVIFGKKVIIIYQPGKLQEYMGRVEYYGTEADSINRG